jgi:hypothetical protein
MTRGREVALDAATPASAVAHLAPELNGVIGLAPASGLVAGIEAALGPGSVTPATNGNAAVLASVATSEIAAATGTQPKTRTTTRNSPWLRRRRKTRKDDLEAALGHLHQQRDRLPD